MRTSIVFCVIAVYISIVYAEHDDSQYQNRNGRFKYGTNYQPRNRYQPYRRPSHQSYQRIEDDDYDSHQYGHQQYYGYRYKKIVCEKLDAPANGDVKQSSVYRGAKAIYTCDDGFVLVGKRIRVCQRNGKFSGIAPTCEPVDCGDPPVPENGDVIFDDTTFRNQATQSCNSGYELQGVVIRTCQANGKWSDDVAICTPVDCGTLDDPENGQVSFTSTTFLSIARYTCDVGFERVGTAVRGCQANGQWSSQAPVCQPVNCGQPDDPDDNGSVDVDRTTFGSTATYSCNDGYILTGSETVECQADRSWSDTAPACIPVDCGQPESPDPNGAVSVGETTLGNTATYSCNSGFDLVGSSIVTCLASGQWSDGAPTCQSVDCGQPDDPDDNGSVNVDSTTFGSTATYSCDDGYILTGSETVVCQADRSWSDTAPACIPVDCGPLSDPDNGAVTTDPDTTLNSVATYRCRRGFKLIGGKKRTCETSGEWSGEEPTCEKIRCPKLKAPKYGKIYISGFYPGDHVIYRCAYGYDVHGGKRRRVCQHSGVWSGSDVECKKREPEYGYQYKTHHGGRYYDDDQY